MMEPIFIAVWWTVTIALFGFFMGKIHEMQRQLKRDTRRFHLYMRLSELDLAYQMALQISDPHTRARLLAEVEEKRATVKP